MTFRALVVDDSAFARATLIKFIKARRPDWEVDEASDGNVALEKCGPDKEYGLMTIDMHMPNMDGLTLASELRSQNVPTRLVLITANIQDAVQKRAEQLKLHFIPKPITKAKLDQLLQELAI